MEEILERTLEAMSSGAKRRYGMSGKKERTKERKQSSNFSFH